MAATPGNIILVGQSVLNFQINQIVISPFFRFFQRPLVAVRAGEKDKTTMTG
jgi:hypothetical protein